MKAILPLLCLVLAAVAVVWALLLRPSNVDVKAIVAAELAANPQLRVAKGDKGDQVVADDVRKLLEAVLKESPEKFKGGIGPVGCIVAWSVEEAALPEGWHVCDGAELAAADYPVLTAILKATYGKVEPGKLKLPDFRGFFLRGLDQRDASDVEGVDAERPRNVGQKQRDAIGPHVHNDVTGRSKFHLNDDRLRKEANGGSAFTDNRIDLTGPVVDGGQETRPKNYAIHWIIRIK